MPLSQAVVITGGAAGARAEPSTDAAITNASAAAPAAIGVSERTSQLGSRRRRTGCSIRKNEIKLITSVAATRNMNSGVPLRPVALVSSHRNSGKCHK